MHSPVELIAIVGRHAFEAGREYARAGRARVLAHDPVSGDVSGNCAGSGGRVYQVSVRYETTTHGTIDDVDGRCSCPVANDCKHCVALLLTAMERRPAVARPAGPPHWRTTLDDAFPPPVRDALPLALALAVDLVPPGPGGAAAGPARWRSHESAGTVNIRPMRRGKRARWVSSGAAWSSVRSGWIEGADALQLEALEAVRRLDDAVDPYSYGDPTWISLTDMSNPSLWAALRGLVGRGVALVEARTDRAVTLEPETGSAPVTIRESAEGSLSVRAELHHPRLPSGADVVLIGSPPHGLAWRDDDGAHLAAVDPPATRAWLALSRESDGVTVPTQDRAGFEHTVLPRITRQTWLSPDASFEPTPPPPPALHLELDVTPLGEASAVPRARLTWSWHYRDDDDDGHGYGPYPLAAAATDPIDPTDPVRDGEAESRLAAGAASALASLPETLDGDRVRPRSEVTGLDVVTLVNDVVPALRDLGVVLDRADLPSYRDAGAPQIRVSVTEADRDWFDLEVTVRVAGHEVPIGHVIAALAQGADVLFLPDGSYVTLADPELERLRELIAESRAITDQRRAGLRVSRLATSWWEELLALGVVETAEHAWFDALRTAVANPPEPAPVPAGLRAELRAYQREGFEWLARLRRSGLGGVLADDMGLGKTLQALAMILDEREDRAAASREGPSRPWLVVAPTSVVPGWAAEAARFAPGLRVAVVSATRAKRSSSLAALAADADVVVTSYTLLRLETQDYAALGVAGLVLDEAQNVKNHASKAFASAKRVGAPMTFAITGTPMENNLAELWSMFALAAPGLLGSPAQFGEAYRTPIERGGESAVGASLQARLRRRIAPFLLRRAKEEVATDLPPKQEQVVRVELAPGHRRVYDRHLQRERQRVLRLVDDLDRNRVEVLSALTRLRQLAIDPALVEETSTAPSSKLDTLLPLLAEAAAEGHRALVFSQFTRYLAMIGRRLDAAGLGYSYLDGSTRRREAAIRGFAEGTDPVFLISLKAGGVGLNLAMADYAVLADPWWNPATEAQAVDRAHRIGQTKPVMVYRLVSTDTIEEKVMALQESKRELVAGILGTAENGAEAAGPARREGVRQSAGTAGLTADDLRELLG